MNIKLNPRRNIEGGLWLLVFLVLVVATFAGCGIYSMAKLIRKYDPITRQPTETNSTTINLYGPYLPPGTNLAVGNYLQGRWWETTTNTGTLMYVEDETEMDMINDTPTNDNRSITVIVGLSNGIPHLTITNTATWTNTISYTYGMEGGGISYSNFLGGTPAGLLVEIYRSTNFMDLMPPMNRNFYFMPVYLCSNQTTMFQVQATNNLYFYRAQRP